MANYSTRMDRLQDWRSVSFFFRLHMSKIVVLAFLLISTSRVVAAGDQTGAGLEFLALAAGWFLLLAFVLRKQRSRKGRIVLAVSVFAGLGVSAILGFIPYRGNEVLVHYGMWGSLVLAIIANLRSLR
jgi:multisubunit Na+/H+ antiporter MnhB subunit